MTFERMKSSGVFCGTLNGLPLAVKRIQLHDLEESIHREETTMRQLDHPNVLKLLHVQENEDFK
jgi:serine/threonine protein kinase